uniref:RE20092p n=1 Tax=Drosophila melanogaster TaxID=7227 RepID=Q8SZ29_DROME|nr:RE20092p [Drosophila melanogaster]
MLPTPSAPSSRSTTNWEDPLRLSTAELPTL